MLGNDTNELRILSLDMGIRNLAFACLRAPDSRFLRPELIAWHRLAVEDIESLNLGSKVPSNLHSLQYNLDPTNSPGEPPSTSSAQSPSPIKIQDPKETTFSPFLYAQTAYKLITTLLEHYSPTHVLIERQRFRSGSSSAVLEWTLRVGVLEGMLYAVLRTLCEERGSLRGLEVCGVEPRRVVRYWSVGDDLARRSPEGGGKAKKRVTAREVKQGKIDLVGGWLDGALGGGSGDGGEKIIIPHDATATREMASAYLRKWRGEARGKKKDLNGGGIGKLDDLADCLLQGVTWLEWQVMRERLLREGVGAIDTLRSS